jgi:hypothetical protein
MTEIEFGKTAQPASVDGYCLIDLIRRATASGEIRNIGLFLRCSTVITARL